MLTRKLEKLFCSRLGEMGAELAAAVGELRSESANGGAVDQIYQVAHSLHGAGTMYGFPSVSDVGASLEDIARAVRSGDLSLARDLLDLIQRCADTLQEASGPACVTRELQNKLRELAWACQCTLHDTAANGA
ncbi:MAG: Hpt domain-containing protein [Planctomycetota bacterium]